MVVSPIVVTDVLFISNVFDAHYWSVRFKEHSRPFENEALFSVSLKVIFLARFNPEVMSWREKTTGGAFAPPVAVY